MPEASTGVVSPAERSERSERSERATWATLRSRQRAGSTVARLATRVPAALMTLTVLTGCSVAPAESRASTTPNGATSNRPTSTPPATPTRSTNQPRPSQAPGTQQSTGSGEPTALGVLATLSVKGRAPMTGYDRDQYGPAWLDANRNGCDTRNDILTRDLVSRRYDPATHGCVVLAGVLPDPYTGTRIDFVRGEGDLVDIDHVVALGNSWATGAFGWQIRKRAALANDPVNLLAVDAGANRSKGDGDAATWLPPNKAYRCRYVARQVAVKDKYGLWVTAAEKAAIARILTRCPRQPVPTDSGAPVIAPVTVSTPSPSTRPAPRHRGAPEPGSAYYANCDAARAAGAAPVHRADPGYASHLDRDGDGVGCE